MSLAAPIVLISVGSVILFLSAIFGFGGYPYLIKSSFAGILKAAMAKSENTEIWIKNPLPIHVIARTFNMTAIPVTKKGPNNAGLLNNAFKDKPGYIIGLGEAVFTVKMDTWASVDEGEITEEEKIEQMDEVPSEDTKDREGQEDEEEYEEEVTPKLVPIVWAPESFSIDAVQRFSIVLASWHINGYIIIGALLLSTSFILIPVGVLMLKNVKNNGVSEYIEKKVRIFK